MSTNGGDVFSNSSAADGVNASSSPPPPNALQPDGFFYAYLLLFVIGTIFNLLTLATLSHASLRGWSTQVLLAALSVIDSLALLTSFLVVLRLYGIFDVIGPKSCKFFALVSSSSSSSSLCLSLNTFLNSKFSPVAALISSHFTGK